MKFGCTAPPKCPCIALLYNGSFPSGFDSFVSVVTGFQFALRGSQHGSYLSLSVVLVNSFIQLIGCREIFDTVRHRLWVPSLFLPMSTLHLRRD